MGDWRRRGEGGEDRGAAERHKTRKEQGREEEDHGRKRRRGNLLELEAWRRRLLLYNLVFLVVTRS